MMNKRIIALIIILLIIATITYNIKPAKTTEKEPQALTDWQIKNNELVRNAGMTKYLANTDYYALEDPLIITTAQNIASKSTNARDAALKAAEHVYNTVKYVPGEQDDNCFNGKAPDILRSGKGQCDTQSIALISILRRMGIPAVPAGGCLVFNPKCEKFAVFAPGVKNSFTIDLNKTTFSRGFDPKALQYLFQSTLVPGIGRYGGLHAWVMAWIDGEWKAIEATTGSFAEGNCYYYYVEIYPSDDQKDDICVTKNFNYASSCKYDNIDGLKKYGLGLVTEVNPN